MRSLSPRHARALAACLIAVTLSPLTLPLAPAQAAVGDADIEDIERVKRGKKNIRVRADVGDPGLTCQLKIKYPDGNADSPDHVVANAKGVCELSFDVPSRRSVVGEAVAKLTVLDSKGHEVAKTSRWFTVRDRRG
jgi:hypothetical protein